jgi:hypothetical protein
VRSRTDIAKICSIQFCDWLESFSSGNAWCIFRWCSVWTLARVSYSDLVSDDSPVPQGKCRGAMPGSSSTFSISLHRFDSQPYMKHSVSVLHRTVKIILQHKLYANPFITSKSKHVHLNFITLHAVYA